MSEENQGEVPTTPTRKPQVRGLEWREKFLAALKACGTVRYACEAAGVNYTTAYEHRKKDEAFRASWDEAVEMALDALEFKAFKIAFGSAKTDEEEAVPPDKDMLKFMLVKRRRGVYGERTSVEVTGAEGGPIQHEEWNEEKRLAAHARLVARVGQGAGTAPADGESPANGSVLDGAGVDHEPGETTP